MFGVADDRLTGNEVDRGTPENKKNVRKRNYFIITDTYIIHLHLVLTEKRRKRHIMLIVSRH